MLLSTFGVGITSFLRIVKKIIGLIFKLPYIVITAILMFPYRFIENSFIAKRIEALAKNDQALETLETESIKLLEKDSEDVSASQAALIRGDRRAAAELLASPKKFPHLYMSVPDDLERSIIEDGRICNGQAPATALAGVTLTGEYVVEAWKDATRAAMRVGYILLVAFAVSAFFGIAAKSAVNSVIGTLSSNKTGHALPAMKEGNTEAKLKMVAEHYADVFDEAAAVKIFDEVQANSRRATDAEETANTVNSWISGFVSFIVFMLGAALATVAIARVFWIARLRGVIFNSVDVSMSPLRYHMREALQRWRWRMPERDMLLSAYADQVKFATEIDKSPTIEIGTSIGLMEHRGHLLAPLRGTTIKMSIADILQHVEVLGGSGEGKSRNLYVPVVRQLIALRKQGYPISIYATDDKGAIGADIVEAANEAGLDADEVVTIGTAPNDYRIDLCETLSPPELADIIQSVSAQVSGDRGDSFWPEMASDLISQVGVVLQAYERTTHGKEWMEINNQRSYSIMNILRVGSDDRLIADIATMIVKSIKEEIEVFRGLNLEQITGALSYFTGMYLPLVDQTKDGIKANMRKALKSFAAQPQIAEGFASGRGEKMLPASVLMDARIKIVNVSQIEFGSAGRMVAVMLKTLLFKQARMAELRNPKSAKERLKWWFNPDLSIPADELNKKAITIFLADEYQALVTASSGDGLSDATAWNVLRSAGIGGIVLSQSVSAFRMALGSEATENMRRNWRTKIILRTEDLDTIEEAKKLAGKTMRFYSLDNSLIESAASAKREFDVAPERMPKLVWTDDMEKFPTSYTLATASNKYEFKSFEKPYELDTRFVGAGNSLLINILTGSNGPINDVSNAMQNAYWRQEDKISGALQHGIVDVDAVRDEDIMEMGRARALVFVQRGGGTRVDVVELNA